MLVVLVVLAKLVVLVVAGTDVGTSPVEATGVSSSSVPVEVLSGAVVAA